MSYYDDINTDYCPNCHAKIQGMGSCECITYDNRCSSCGVPLKNVRIEVCSPSEAPYILYAIEIDVSRLKKQQ
ncbi:hypothetical protein PU683_06675 [Kosakonia cowanii]|uniref:hypothetical protein n=1 Tax=Kosakonia cowanii TaxID=208223 RepID=UPI0023FA3345|nr:hypothetical protein [Kosakonia cowanii]MDF7759214.1 hypothetical protein [Kosakonia cowanii]